ncbi:MAG: SDR family oxidoreductase [Pseudomonadota bacterium]
MPNHDKTILITGCSSGIGACAARTLQARGYRVIATARKAQDVMQLKAEGFTAVPLDLNDSNSIQSAVAQILEITGGNLYALFNNAAYGQPGAVEDLRREVLRAQFETNLFGTLELTNAVIPIMRRQGYGRIIQNSSVLGLFAMPYRGAYNASKFALEGITDTLRLELRGSGIHISLIEPGPIKSAFRKNAMQHFFANIDREHSFHRKVYQGVEQRLAKPGPAAPFTLPPEAVVEKLIHALEARHPKRRYYVTVPTHLFARLRRILPTAAMDAIARLVSKDENRE